ncbi:hypothetical protein ABEW61_24425 [Paenibacillus amylolyticus]|uniref:hypothetical protein n=1 Tax=Paenibacillus amylolyticus TaxID=1451 RepID=UPI003D294192
MTLNREYIDKTDSKFWREIGVKFDAFNELTDARLDNELLVILSTLSLEALIELGTLFKIDNDLNGKGEIQDSFKSLTKEQKLQILLCRDFQLRKKKTLRNFYDDRFHKSETKFIHTISQVIHLFNESQTNLIEVLAWHLWDNKGSDEQFTMSGKITMEQALKVPREGKDKLVDSLYKKTGRKNNYKVHSYATLRNENLLVVLYRQINDAPRPDFEEAIRNKEVAPVLFTINISDGTIQVKSSTKLEKEAIKEFVSDAFNCKLTLVSSELFTEYSPEKIKAAVIHGTPVSDAGSILKIHKISFRGSQLKNSPNLTLGLKNIEIWPSVEHAYEKGIIEMESLKDISSLHLTYGDVNRTIRTVMKDDGNIIFLMDDSGITKHTKLSIDSEFKNRFGFPLNTVISNEKFDDGKVDKVDLIMSKISTDDFYTDETKQLYRHLIDGNILNSINSREISCGTCGYKEVFEQLSSIPTGCPEECGTALREKMLENYYVNKKEVNSYIKRTLKSLTEWSVLQDSELSLYDKKYKFINLSNQMNDKKLQVIVAENSLSGRVIRRIEKMLTPTMIIFIGEQEKNIESYNANCIYPVTFGNIYIKQEHEFSYFVNKIYESLDRRTKSILSDAAIKAHESITKTSGTVDIDQKYKDKEFEDDVFAILKDMFSNCEKWGKEMSGKAVPEGIFAMSWTNKNGNNTDIESYVFSYDCKLTRKEKGYDLGKDEQRKALDYVVDLNRNSFVNRFSRRNQLSAHIFISNRFDANNFNTMQEHFYKMLGDDYDTRPIFIDSETFVHMYKLYLEKFEVIGNSPNVFKANLFKLFTSDNCVITIDDINKSFKKILRSEQAEIDVLSTGLVKEEILDI